MLLFRQCAFPTFLFSSQGETDRQLEAEVRSARFNDDVAAIS